MGEQREAARRNPWVTAAGVLALALGLALAAASVRLWTDRAAYVRALTCAETGGSGDCLGRRDATALAPATRSGGQHRVRVAHRRAVPPRAYDVTFAREEPAVRAVREDLRVTLHWWHGRPVRLEVPRVGTAETVDSPAAVAPRRSLEALLALATGAGLLVLGRGRHGALAGGAAVAVAAGALAGREVVVGWGGYGLAEAFGAAAGVAASTGVVLWLARRRVSRTARAASRRTPSAAHPAAP